MISTKKQARNAVTYAITTGRLVRQPCEQCGEAASQAHHDDYSRPLDVRWLCRPCHDKAHGRGVDVATVVKTHAGGARTLQEVAAVCGISHPRVHQILSAQGITARRYKKRPDVFGPAATKKRARAAA